MMQVSAARDLQLEEAAQAVEARHRQLDARELMLEEKRTVLEIAVRLQTGTENRSESCRT